MSLSNAEIREVIDILNESGWDEAEVTIADLTLAVSKSGPVAPGSPAAAAAPPAPGSDPPSPSPGPPTATAEPAGHVVRSPSVGVFWRSPEPGAAPFVEVGEKVSAGQTLCIVKVMKLMQHVTAEVDGEVTAIHVENSAQVEFDTPLFSLG